MSRHCEICYDDIQESHVQCSKKCPSYVCHECFALYISSSYNELNYPRCVSCDGQYLLPLLSNLSKTTEEQLDTLTLSYICNKMSDSVEARMSIKNSIRKNFTEYMSHFPESVKICMEICYKDVKRSMEKKILKNEESKLESKYKRVCSCSRNVCDGVVFVNLETHKLICNCCAMEHCADCNAVLENEHTCKPEDVEATKLRGEMVSCPKCFVLIHRSEGCSDMRCTVCGVNFNYNTGQIGGAGNNHNQHITQKQRKRILIHVDHADKLDADQHKRLRVLEKYYVSLQESPNFERSLEMYLRNKSTQRRQRVLDIYHKNAIIKIVREFMTVHLDKIEKELLGSARHALINDLLDVMETKLRSYE